MGNRIEKINDLIRDQISFVINQALSFKEGVFVTVAKVDTHQDLRYCKIFVSVFPPKEKEYALVTLRKNVNLLQKELYRKIKIKYSPRIEFVDDEKLDQVDEIEEIFNQIKDERKVSTINQGVKKDQKTVNNYSS